MYEWEWERLVALAVGILLLVVALSLLVLGPSAKTNRRLCLLLGAEGVALVAGWAMAQMATDLAHARFWTTVAWAVYAALVPLYLLFLATLRTPLVRPLAHAAATGVLSFLAAAGPVLAVLRPDLFFDGFVPREGTSTFLHTPGPLASVLPAVNALPLPLFALVAAVDQWRRTSTTDVFRRQAGAYALAFGWRDLSWMFILFVLPATTGTSVTDSHATPTLVYAILSVVFMLLLVYGILSAQLFDIDVRARFIIGQSTVAAVAAGLFFLVKELAENVVEVEGVVPALATAAVVTVAFNPLQRFGRRVATRVLPVRSAGEESEHRLQIYHVALRGYLEGGALTARQQAALDEMRARLGLREADVAHLHEEPAATA